jgi:Flp pilus assembly protein TadG
MDTTLHGKPIGTRSGTAPREIAIIVPLVLLILVGIVEFGRAYQTWQVLTHAARAGARVAAAGSSDEQVESAVRERLQAGRLPDAATVPVMLNRRVPAGAATSSQITISYPFDFVVLNPAAHLVRPASTTGSPWTMSAVATMRNES